MPAKTKSAWYSKTNLLGLVQILTGVAGVLAGSELIQQYPKAVSSIAVATGVLTIVLRTLTTLPVEW